MAAGNFTLFSKNKDDIRVNDLLGATIKLALVSSAWTPDASVTGNSLWADMSANEVSGNGWTAGGITLANDLATAISGGFKYSSDNVAATAAGGSIPAWRYAVMYVSGALWGMTNPVIGYFLGDTTPADVPATTVGNTLTVACPANGWFDIT
jgi:hypothetical protein